MRAVDTNVLIRLITRDDGNQLRAAEHFVANGAWVSPLVLTEAMWVLDAVYERSPQQIATALEMLLNHQQLAIHDGDVVASALAHYVKRPSLGFSDCLILELARKAGHLPLGTFDRSLAKVEGAERIN